MKIEQIISFDNEDIKLLNTVLPKNPCDKCYSKGLYCLGCNQEREYRNIISPYKERNIYDYAILIRRKNEIDSEIKRLEEEKENINKEFPKELLPYLKK